MPFRYFIKEIVLPSPSGKDYDVIIVGARIAGSILATALGQMGHKVLVLDRAQFPSDTLSTHFFRDPTFRALERTGVFEEVKGLAPALTVNHNVVDGHEFDEAVQIGGEASFYLCVRRIHIDNLLVKRLRALASITFREGALVDQFLERDKTMMGVRWTEGGSTFEATARVVVGADGLRSSLASHTQPEIETGQKVERMMYYAYFAGFEGRPEPAAEFHYQGNTLAYVFPTSDGQTLIALSLPIAEFKDFKRKPDRSFFDGIGRYSGIAGRVAKAELASRVMGSGAIPSYQRFPYGRGWALVGDAGQVMDPWSGQGMDQASTHAVLLAESLDVFLSGTLEWGTAMAQFHHRRNGFSLKAFQRTTTFAPDLRPMTRAALSRRGLT